MMRLEVPYFGMPGLMLEMPSPTSPMDAGVPSRGEVVHKLIDGGSTVTRWGDVKRTWSIPLEWLDEDEADVVWGLYTGLIGDDGQLVYVDPSFRNQLPMDASACGKRTSAAIGWVQAVGAPTPVRSSTAPPDEAPLSGVLAWTPSATEQILRPGSTLAAADTATAPVKLVDQPFSASLFVRAAADTAVTFAIGGFDANGSLQTVMGVPFDIGTDWRQLYATAAPYEAALANDVYLLPMIFSTDTTTLYVAGAMGEYSDEPSPIWHPGYGCARVNFSAGPGRNVPLLRHVTHTLGLVEC